MVIQDIILRKISKDSYLGALLEPHMVTSVQLCPVRGFQTLAKCWRAPSGALIPIKRVDDTPCQDAPCLSTIAFTSYRIT